MKSTFSDVEIPGRVPLRAKELLPHIVVDTDDAMALPVKVLDGLRANQAAAACDQNGLHVCDRIRAIILSRLAVLKRVGILASSIGPQNEATERIGTCYPDCGVASGNVGQGSILMRGVPAIICSFHPIDFFLNLVTGQQFRQPFFSINPVPRDNRRVLPARYGH